MKPAQVLDMQGDLLSRLETIPEFVESVQNVLTLDVSRAREETGARERMARAHAGQLTEAIKKQVRLAYAYRVTDEMSALVQIVASQLDETDRFDRTMAPTEWGIVRFDRPLPIQDVRGGLMQAHWLTWGPAYGGTTDAFGREVSKPGMVLSWWNDLADPDPYAQAMFRDMDPGQSHRTRKYLGRWAIDGAEVALDGAVMGAPTITVPLVVQARLIAEGAEIAEFTNTTRYAYALFLLLNQTLTRVTEEEIPRSAQARIGRMPIPGRVSVITLRRRAGAESAGESLVEWSHRWLVRGFPAWRKCGSEKPYAQPYEKGWRVRVYVAPYVKGPEDKPLVITNHVYNLSR